jgi:hypothetical protein
MKAIGFSVGKPRYSGYEILSWFCPGNIFSVMRAKPSLHSLNSAWLVASGRKYLNVKNFLGLLQKFEQAIDRLIGDDIRSLPAAGIGMAYPIKIEA